ncbi:MAG TPA: hypothetical protein VL992_09495 [Tepidisphaeraceae bacterium]|nr:hypothetical protein [Tepidisphaeraceae bacterium]
MKRSWFFVIGLVLLSTSIASAQTPADGPYKVINSVKVGGDGGWDYVYADSADRKLFIPRGNRVTVFDLDTLAPLGTIPDTNRVHGVVVDPDSGHGFASCNPVVMFDPKTLTTIKTIDVEGRPDGILLDPFTHHVMILSHSDPNVTVINAADGAVVGTIDLGGEPEQGASDGAGHLYIDLENQNSIAVVDSAAMKCTGHYDISSKGSGPGGMAMDVKNRILFSFCHDPAVCVILNADTGNILATLPTGQGVDAAEFNPATMEAFSSQGDGTLTVIKENSPTDFAVEQTVKTKTGARTSTLDSKTNQIYLITADFMAPASQPTGQTGGRRRRAIVPGSFTILTVGR